MKYVETSNSGGYHVPTDWASREALRSKGQFWTPPWVSRAMVGFALARGSTDMFDPAVGLGAFFESALELIVQNGATVALSGTDVDPSTQVEAHRLKLNWIERARVEIRDFVLDTPRQKHGAIVANPPYVRHHRMSQETKQRVREIGTETIGAPLDGRAGLHNYFLILSLTLLKRNGRLAFILPADTFEGISSKRLWSWITSRYRLYAAITFAPEASPFVGVDTNPVVVLLENSPPKPEFVWAKCLRRDTPSLAAFAADPLGKEMPTEDLYVETRLVEEGIATGLSRQHRPIHGASHRLRDYATVMRGIATGANEFFLFDRARAEQLRIPGEFLVPVIVRTRDVGEDRLTTDHLHDLDQESVPTLLLYLGDQRVESLPPTLRSYLAKGEAMGVSKRPLISTRKPWYKMERRDPPPILFAYLGRRNCRFILNDARALPTNSFIAVYPLSGDRSYVTALFRVLRRPEVLEGLQWIGKSYGDGAVKVEPRSLDQLEIADSVASEEGLIVPGLSR